MVVVHWPFQLAWALVHTVGQVVCACWLLKIGPALTSWGVVEGVGRPKVSHQIHGAGRLWPLNDTIWNGLMWMWYGCFCPELLEMVHCSAVPIAIVSSTQ